MAHFPATLRRSDSMDHGSEPEDVSEEFDIERNSGDFLQEPDLPGEEQPDTNEEAERRIAELALQLDVTKKKLRTEERQLDFAIHRSQWIYHQTIEDAGGGLHTIFSEKFEAEPARIACMRAHEAAHEALSGIEMLAVQMPVLEMGGERFAKNISHVNRTATDPPWWQKMLNRTAQVHYACGRFNTQMGGSLRRPAFSNWALRQHENDGADEDKPFQATWLGARLTKVLEQLRRVRKMRVQVEAVEGQMHHLLPLQLEGHGPTPNGEHPEMGNRLERGRVYREMRMYNNLQAVNAAESAVAELQRSIGDLRDKLYECELIPVHSYGPHSVPSEKDFAFRPGQEKSISAPMRERWARHPPIFPAWQEKFVQEPTAAEFIDEMDADELETRISESYVEDAAKAKEFWAAKRGES